MQNGKSHNIFYSFETTNHHCSSSPGVLPIFNWNYQNNVESGIQLTDALNVPAYLLNYLVWLLSIHKRNTSVFGFWTNSRLL